jgi:hypothetical protein
MSGKLKVRVKASSESFTPAVRRISPAAMVQRAALGAGASGVVGESGEGSMAV